MSFNNFYSIKSNLDENNKIKYIFNNQMNNLNNKLCEKTNKLNTNSMMFSNSNNNSTNSNNIKLFSQSINESPSSGSKTITVGFNNNKKKQQQLHNKFKSENLNNTSVSDKIISKVMHTTSSRDSGKILKRSNVDKNKKISAFSVQCYNLAEKERYRQLLDQNMCILHTTNKTNAVNGGNYYQDLVKTAPKEVKDDNALNVKSTKFQLINEKIELPVSNHIASKGLTGYSRRISRLSTNSNNSIISLSSINGTSNGQNNNTNKVFDESSPQVIVINEKKAAAHHLNRSISNNNEKVEKLNNNVNTNGTSQSVKQTTPVKNGKSLLTARLIAPTRKIMRQLTDYELSHEQRLKQNNELIESIFESIKARSGYTPTTSLSEEEYKFNLLKRRRREEELKLAKEFSERLQLNVNKLPQYYFEEEVVEEDEFPELTDEQTLLITKSLVPYPEDEILCKGFNIDIRRKDVQTLKGLNWLNDEIINFYMNLICARNEASRNNNNDVNISAYAFTTFFYPRLVKDGFQAVKRWTKKIDVFNYGILLVPIHLGLHWTLAVIDITNKEIRYYDSMNGYNNECLKALKNYVRDEHLDKKGKSIDLTQWNAIHVQDIPQQMNGSDCGMFTCKYAEFISRGKTTFSFNQSHMPYYRRRMVYEIITKKLL